MAIVICEVPADPVRGKSSSERWSSEFDRGMDQAKLPCSSQGEGPDPRRFLAHSNLHRECSLYIAQRHLFAAVTAQTARLRRNSRRFSSGSGAVVETHIRAR